jgi:hypothetical protein
MKTNGAGAAAVLAAGFGSAMLGVMSFAGDKWPAVKTAMVWYKPTGALSGVTTVAIVAWLVSWAMLEGLWRGKNVAVGSVSTIAFGLLGIGFLLTFPPVMDLF